jgi:hypothetical protein
MALNYAVVQTVTTVRLHLSRFAGERIHKPECCCREGTRPSLRRVGVRIESVVSLSVTGNLA